MKKLFLQTEKLSSIEKFLIPKYYENSQWRIIANMVWCGILFFIFIFTMLILTIKMPVFFNPRNIKHIFNQVIIVMILIPAAVILFSNRGFDFSVGSIAAFTALTIAKLSNNINTGSAIFMVFFIVIVIGIINSTLTGFLRIPGIIVTFIMMFLLRYLVIMISQGKTISFTKQISRTGVFAFGWILFLLLAVISFFWVQFPLFGPKKSGITENNNKSWLVQSFFTGLPYLISSLAAGYCGLMILLYIRAGTLNAGNDYPIKLILILLAGGVVFGGYYGNTIGAIIGMFFITCLNNFFTLANAGYGISNFIIIIIFTIIILINILYNVIISYFYTNNTDNPGKIE